MNVDVGEGEADGGVRVRGSGGWRYFEFAINLVQYTSLSTGNMLCPGGPA